MQRQQHQAKPDRNPAEVANPGARAVLEDDDADPEQNRGEHGNIEAENLNNQGRADIGAQHDRQCGNQPDQPVAEKGRGHQGGGGTALQQRGDSDAGQRRR